MFVVDLSCSAGHSFEGWYDSSDEYTTLAENREVTCPLCGSAEIERHLSTGGFLSTTRAEAPAPTRPTPVPLEVQKAMSAVVQWVRRTHEDVGDAFATTARAIHEEREPARPIYGRSTPEEERALRDDGIVFGKVPVPDIERN